MISKSPDGNVVQVDDLIDEMVVHGERIFEVESWLFPQDRLEFREQVSWRVDAQYPTAVGMVPATDKAHFIPSILLTVIDEILAILMTAARDLTNHFDQATKPEACRIVRMRSAQRMRSVRTYSCFAVPLLDRPQFSTRNSHSIRYSTCSPGNSEHRILLVDL
jgi:hypothetical protein